MKRLELKKWLFTHQDLETNWQKDIDDSQWSVVSVPHDWSIHEPFDINNSSGTGYLPGGIGWYRSVSTKSGLNLLQGDRITLHFDGIYKRSEIWINGYHLGGQPSGYSEMFFDITELLSYSEDDDITISIRVDHSDIADSRWYTGSGINRPVWLEIRKAIDIPINGTTITTENVSSASAKVMISQKIDNHDHADTIVINQDIFLAGATKPTVSSKNQFLAGESSSVSTCALIIDNPELWSPDHPKLYRLITTFTKGNVVIASNEVFFGINSTIFDPNQGFILNGKQLKLKGVCIHDDAGSFGSAVPAEVWIRRLLRLKDMGVNAIRMSHNPHSPILYKLCDVIGFCVFDEAFDEWENPKNKWSHGHNVYPPKFEGYAHDFPAWYEQDLRNMVQRNKNHPSIIAWSIGNEIDYPNDPYANQLFTKMTGNNDNNKPEQERFFNPKRPDTRRLSTISRQLAAIIRQEDQTRPVTLAAAFPELSADTGLLDTIDLIGYNYKEHLYAKDHLRFPNKPFIGSENSHSYQDWVTVLNNDYVAGQFLWTGIDYLGEAAGWPIHGSGAGFLTLAGNKKPEFYLRKSWWSNKPVIRMFTRKNLSSSHPEWEHVERRWDYQAGAKIDVRIYSNCVNIELRLGAKLLSAPKYNSEYGYYESTIAYEESKLSVKGEFDNKTITDELTSVGVPTKFSTNNWSVPINLSAVLKETGLIIDQSLHQIEISLLDRHNQLSDSSALIQVSVTGNATLLGLENGDLADTTAYTCNYRHALHGKLIAYVYSLEADSSVEIKSIGVAPTVIKLKEFL